MKLVSVVEAVTVELNHIDLFVFFSIQTVKIGNIQGFDYDEQV